MRRVGRRWAASLVLVFLFAGCGSDSAESTDPPPDRVVGLLDAVGRTILGQEFSYPASGPAQVTASVLTLQPGEQTGWHHHEAPLFAYVMEGAVTVDYGEDGTRTYRTGDSIMEALNLSHNGSTEGDGQVRILVVNMGAAGVTNTISDQ